MQVVTCISTSWQEVVARPGMLRHGPGHTFVILWPLRISVPHSARGILDAEEQCRAERFLYDHHRESFIAAHCGMRRLLGTVLGCDAGALSMLVDANGKPHLDGHSLRFNLSHSGDWAALAISQDGEVGMDIEMIRSVERGLPEHYFSIHEQRALSALTGKEWSDGFFRCWTRKEALLKAVGTGLSLPLDSFSVTIDSNLPALLVESSLRQLQSRDWSMLHVGCIPGYMGAMAASRSMRSISVLILDAGINGEIASR